jgi:Bacterial protein of unknown function (DUF922)
LCKKSELNPHLWRGGHDGIAFDAIIKNKAMHMTRNIKIHAALILMLGVASVMMSWTDPTNLTVWDPNTKLTWKDFRDTIITDSHRAALTTAGVRLSLSQTQADKVSIEAYCVMDHDRSWVDINKQSDNLLSHEQYHFNISEYWCRKLKKELSATKLTNKNLKEKIRSIQQENFAQCKEMENQYDEETNHSLIEPEQRKWEKKVDALLKSLDEYAGPSLTLAVR